jgi:hypothetical protein
LNIRGLNGISAKEKECGLTSEKARGLFANVARILINEELFL